MQKIFVMWDYGHEWVRIKTVRNYRKNRNSFKVAL